MGKPEIEAGALLNTADLLAHAVGLNDGVNAMTKLIRNFMNDESGAAAAEYALILAIVGAAIGGAAFLLGGEVKTSIAGAAGKVKTCGAQSTAGCEVVTAIT